MNAYRIFVGKPEGKRPLGRPRRRWVDNIKIGLREIGWDDLDWIDLAEDRDQMRALVNTMMNVRVLQNAGKFFSSCTIGGFSRRAQLHDNDDDEDDEGRIGPVQWHYLRSSF
jgi:hypothetical protein